MWRAVEPRAEKALQFFNVVSLMLPPPSVDLDLGVFQVPFLSCTYQTAIFPFVPLYLCESERKWAQGAAFEPHSAGAVQG